jgi:hypothetical protein
MNILPDIDQAVKVLNPLKTDPQFSFQKILKWFLTMKNKKKTKDLLGEHNYKKNSVYVRVRPWLKSTLKSQGPGYCFDFLLDVVV